MLLAWISTWLFSVISLPNSSKDTTTAASFIVQKSPYSLQQSIAKLRFALQKRQISIFAEIDHSHNAKTVEDTLPSNYLIIFGNPAVGTKLMQENALFGLELPLKILVFQQDEQVFFAYKNLDNLNHRQSGKSAQIVSKMKQLLHQIITELAGK